LMLVLERLHSIFSIPENHNDTGPVTAFHSSLYECLTSKDRAGVFFIDPRVKHAALAKNCLNHIKIISSNVSFFFCYPSDYRSIIEDHFRLCSDAEKAVIKYACRYWSFHLSKTYRRGSPNEFAAAMNNFVFRDMIAWSILLLLDAQPNMNVAREREWEQTRESERNQELVARTQERIRISLKCFTFIPLTVWLAICFTMVLTGQLRSILVILILSIGGLISASVIMMALLHIEEVVEEELNCAHQDVKICLSQARPWINIWPYRIYHNIILYRALQYARRFREQAESAGADMDSAALLVE